MQVAERTELRLTEQEHKLVRQILARWRACDGMNITLEVRIQRDGRAEVFKVNKELLR
jgi:hypothetical protein